jgi:hypothetical protein
MRSRQVLGRRAGQAGTDDNVIGYHSLYAP